MREFYAFRSLRVVTGVCYCDNVYWIRSFFTSDIIKFYVQKN